jgi:protein-tyrosine phosphatase
MLKILVLCSANRCRSPMGGVLLRERLGARGVEAAVRSAGTSPAVCTSGAPMIGDAEVALSRLGLDPPSHRSRPVTASLVEGADLVLGMTREHVREAVALVPEAWPRAFTLKEFVRRGRESGGRRLDEPLDAWLTHLGGARVPRDILGDSPDDDIDDPTGGPFSAFLGTAHEIDALATTTADLIAGAGTTT